MNFAKQVELLNDSFSPIKYMSWKLPNKLHIFNNALSTSIVLKITVVMLSVRIKINIVKAREVLKNANSIMFTAELL